MALTNRVRSAERESGERTKADLTPAVSFFRVVPSDVEPFATHVIQNA
jgi:hypothetical protein